MTKEQLKLKQFCISLHKDRMMKAAFSRSIKRLKNYITIVSDNDFIFIYCNDEIAELARNYKYYVDVGFRISSSEKQDMRDNLSNYIKQLCKITLEK